MAAYTGDIGPVGHSLPLRIAGGLHALVLTGQSDALIASYPPNTFDHSAQEVAVSHALVAHEDFMLEWTQSPPQTNKVRRSAALIAGAQVTLEYFQSPLVLSELGASAGLNLMCDHYALDIAGQTTGPQTPALTLNPDWTGPCPPSNSINIAERAGVELNPLNPRLAPDLLPLTAYLWADQPYRLTLSKAAAATIDVEIEESDAIDWLATRLANLRTGHLHLIENSVAWQYFPNSSQACCLELIEQAGARATAETPLAWLSMENDGNATVGAGAALTLRLGPSDTSLHLGRVDFHGRWVDWRHSN